MGSRLRRLATVALTVLTLAATASSCGARSAAGQRHYCAMMPDAIGLYIGNPVTQMGFRIGTVTAVSPAATEVRVGFTVTADRALPADVKAAIRSTSVLADRSLELVGNYTGGPELAAEPCIPVQRSATPKSLSQIVQSMAAFVDTVSPDGSDNVADTVAGLDRMLANRGVRAGDLLTRLSA
ncbi:MAG TPA: MlaD family protein, partial [Mycobacterium sp.]|nr:MlaD family protein [Mycobacterium sp.]